MNHPFDDIYIPSTDGLRLHARIYGDANCAKVPVVCLPGLTRNAQDFHVLAERLAAPPHSRRVIVMDYRGRGLAVTHGNLIKACVLNDIGPVIELKGLERIASYVGKGTMPRNWAEAVEKLKASNVDFADLTDAEWRDFADIVFVEAADGLRLRYDPTLGNALADIDFTKPLPAAWPLFDALGAVPVLAIRGMNSDLLSDETLAEMAGRHPTMEIARVPNEGHAPFLGRARIAGIIADFVTRVG